jgi:hypothetical protein
MRTKARIEKLKNRVKEIEREKNPWAMEQVLKRN